MTSRAFALTAALLLSSGSAFAAEADSVRDVRDTGTVTHGILELHAGLLTLPRADVCIERGAGCSTGDNSFALSAWPLFRRGAFAAGAGVMMGLTSSGDAPHNDPLDVPRSHTRRYFSMEATARYYLPFNEKVDGYVGIAMGLGVVNDTFQSKTGVGDKALVGPQGATLLTEGFTLGVGAGMAYAIAQNWRLGGGAGVSMWFLPTTPVTDPFLDQASLTGAVLAIQLAVSIGYQTRLVF